MPSFADQTGRTIIVDKTPRRIVSLVPSQTELMYDLGLHDEVVCITKFCVYPDAWFKTKTRVGGTKQLKLETIHQLDPDLIIANKEENVKEQVEELAMHYPVWISDVNDQVSANNMIRQVGLITGRSNIAEEIIQRINKKFTGLSTSNPVLRTVYLIWQKPYMTVGGDTFIHSMLEKAGFENIFANESRYPELALEELQLQNPQLILLSSEPFPFKQHHIDELQPFLPGTKIVLVDGEMFSWYGSRMILAAEYFHKLNDDIKRMMIE